MPIDPITSSALVAIAKAAAQQLSKRESIRCSCGGEMLGPGWFANAVRATFMCCSGRTCLNCFLAFQRRGSGCPVCQSTSVPEVVVGDGAKVYKWYPGGKIVVV